jgi:hypothetical protein
MIFSGSLQKIITMLNHRYSVLFKGFSLFPAPGASAEYEQSTQKKLKMCGRAFCQFAVLKLNQMQSVLWWTEIVISATCYSQIKLYGCKLVVKNSSFLRPGQLCFLAKLLPCPQIIL